MGFNFFVLFGSLLVGSLALPPRLEDPTNEDFSKWFDQNDIDPSEGIVGGNPAPEGSAPHMVALTIGYTVRTFWCGGSLISPRTVLTAAHCISRTSYRGSFMQATVGTNRWASGGNTYTIAREIIHQHYDAANAINDIGLLITDEEVKFSKLIKPVTLSYDWVGIDIPVRANGWGDTSARTYNQHPVQYGSSILMELSMRTVDGETCVREVAEMAKKVDIPAAAVRPDLQVCTFKATGHGTCFGDSGSALIQVSNGQQVGIVSWGIPCALGAPDIFTRVSVYKQWIKDNIV